MTSLSLINLDSVNSDLRSAINSSLFEFGQFHSNPEFWAKTSLKNNVEAAIKKTSAKATTSEFSRKDPPGSGFKVQFGLEINLSCKIRVKPHLRLDYGQRYGSFAGTTSLYMSAYNKGMNTPITNNSKFAFDVAASVNLTLGGGEGKSLQAHAVKGTKIPMENNFKNAVSFGETLSWNSAQHDNQFSLDSIQRKETIGFRLGNVNVVTNNDVFGREAKDWWKGGVSIITPIFAVSFQDFYNDTFYNKKNESNRGLASLNSGSYGSGVNKASTYIRLNKSGGYNSTVDLISDAPQLENVVHKTMADVDIKSAFENIELCGRRIW